MFVAALLMLALGFSPWPVRDRTSRVRVVADGCAQLSLVPGEPNTDILHERARTDR